MQPPVRIPQDFAATLMQKMVHVNPGIADLELYEFQYALDNLAPAGGWSTVSLESTASIEQRTGGREFYDNVQIKPTRDGRIVLDENIVRLTSMLLVGLATESYATEWVNAHFYFDVRGFFFLHRSLYFTPAIVAHLGGSALKQFEPRQRDLAGLSEIGYKAFRAANTEVDNAFMEAARRLTARQGFPVLLAIAGPTAAGKTEIVDRLRRAFQESGQQTTSIELDNFLTDRDYRERRGIFTQGKEALHFDLLKRALLDITARRRIEIPRYDFVYATSSHDLTGKLKPGGVAIEIEPADIVFIEGNFPFLIDDLRPLIHVKVVYLTDDPIRLKRKWKRDIDLRKKYEPTYFRNRFFKDQFIMAEIAYRPQMETCDLLVDTTGAAMWATPETAAVLGGPTGQ